MTLPNKGWTADAMVKDYRRKLPHNTEELRAKLLPTAPHMHTKSADIDSAVHELIGNLRDDDARISYIVRTRRMLALLEAVVVDIDARLTALEQFNLED